MGRRSDILADSPPKLGQQSRVGYGFNVLSHRKHLKTRDNATQSLDQRLIVEGCTMQFVNCRPI